MQTEVDIWGRNEKSSSKAMLKVCVSPNRVELGWEDMEILLEAGGKDTQTRSALQARGDVRGDVGGDGLPDGRDVGRGMKEGDGVEGRLWCWVRRGGEDESGDEETITPLDVYAAGQLLRTIASRVEGYYVHVQEEVAKF